MKNAFPAPGSAEGEGETSIWPWRSKFETFMVSIRSAEVATTKKSIACDPKTRFFFFFGGFFFGGMSGTKRRSI